MKGGEINIDSPAPIHFEKTQGCNVSNRITWGKALRGNLTHVTALIAEEL
jgi:hypothetical protein